MYSETSLTLQRGWKCLHCSELNWRSYTPVGSMHCSYCNKKFTPTTSVSASEGMNTKRKTAPFKDRIDAFCDRFHPEIAYIYKDFAVLIFEGINQAYKMTDVFRISPLLCAGLDVSQSLESISLIDKSTGGLSNGDEQNS